MSKIRSERKPIELSSATRSAASDLIPFYTRFTLDVVKNVSEVVKYEEVKGNEGNIVVSPLSAAMMLGMVANGVEEDAATQIYKYLGTSNIEDLNSLCEILLKELPKVDNTANLSLTNSIWINKSLNLSVKEEPKSILEKYYSVELKNENFDEELLRKINQWCSNATQGGIPNYMDNIPGSAYAIFLNALYFQAPWDGEAFLPDRTQPSTFIGENYSSRIIMMESTLDSRSYACNERFQEFSLPFGNSAFTLEIIVPREDVEINSISEEELQSLRLNSEICDLKIWLPKFSLKTGCNLNRLFTQVNLNKIVNGVTFNMFQNNPFANFIYDQSSGISIDESGVKAESVSMGMGITTAPLFEKHEVRVDRPFIFFIREVSTGACIISGKIANLMP